MNTINVTMYAGTWNRGRMVETYDGNHRCFLRYRGRKAQVTTVGNFLVGCASDVESDWIDVALMPTRDQDFERATPDDHAPMAVKAAIDLGIIQ